MYYYLNGQIVTKGLNSVVIDCGGVGYICNVTANTFRVLPDEKNTAKIFTYLNIREDSWDLFGFANLEELNCFKMLLTISGVGPKAALSLLSELTPTDFALAVISNDFKRLQKAQGIGLKLAQRVILELKDKLKGLSPADAVGVDTSGVVSADRSKMGEALNALVVLGYSQTEAAIVLKRIDVQTLTLEQIIREALKLLM